MTELQGQVAIVTGSSSSVEQGTAIVASLPTESIYVRADISDERTTIVL